METDLLVGTVQSGGTIRAQPLADVRVTVYEATAHAPLAVGTAKTDAAGRFSLGTSRTTSDSVFYATASLGQTNCVIDQAGNVWTMNNWKPNFNVDIAGDKANPGGDGIVIFVGLAKPPIKKH